MRLPHCAGLALAALAGCSGGDADPAAPTTSASAPSVPATDALQPWRACLRDSELAGVARETAPNLDLEVEGVRVVTGSLGQRGGDVDAAGDVLRIAAVGGELTFGAGVAQELAWPNALAAQLNHSMLSGGRRAEALNLGTVGASHADRLGLATRRALGWQPWLLVLELDASQPASADLGAGFAALRDAAAQAGTGVLVAISEPPGDYAGDGARWAQGRERIADEARRVGFPSLELRADLVEPPAGPIVDARGHATQQAHWIVLEAVKRRLYDSGLLSAALESH